MDVSTCDELDETVAMRELRLFIVVAFALSWLVGGVGIAVLDLGELGLGLGALCPGIAALVITRIRTGAFRPLWLGIARWRVGLRWYAAALGLPILLIAATVVITRLFTPVGPPAEASVGGALLFLPLAFLLLGGPEEPGWRGYALPRLQIRFGALLASLLLGVIWLVWHLPLWLMPMSSYQEINLGAYAVVIIGFSVIQTWMYNSSGGSVLIAMLFHAQLNVLFAWLPQGDRSLWVYGGLVWAVVAILVLQYGAAHLSGAERVTARTDGAAVRFR